MKNVFSTLGRTIVVLSLGSLSVNGASIFWASSTSDMIHRVNTDGTGLTDITPNMQQAPHGTSGGPWGVAAANGQIYFTQDNDSRLHSVDYDGGSLAELGSGSSIGNARDIHSANNKLYWVTWSGEIKSSNFNGGSVSTLHTVTGGFLQGVFANSQFIYYTNSSNSSSKTISRVDINGGNPTDLVSTGQSIPYGIWATSSNLYWVDLGNGTLSRSNLDGSSVTTLSNTLTRPSGITIYDNHIYITEQHGDLLRLNMDGSNRTTILSGMSDARFLEIVEVPEPSSCAYLGLSLIGLLWRRKALA